MAEIVTVRGAVRLAGDDVGSGPPVVLLHGLTATRRYVVMGSRSLERSGHRVISYDARGHGHSSPAENPRAYDYGELSADLDAVLDARGVERAVLAGASMGAHTLLRFALGCPQRVAGLVLITPAYDPSTNHDVERLERWDALAAGLRRDGIDGFLAAYGEPGVPPAWRESVLKVIRQRLAGHDHLAAVADALQAVPRSRPFEALEDLRVLDVPVAVVASADEADPGHPQAIGEAYAGAIPHARLVEDRPGHSPVAWQGSQVSRVIADVVRDASW